MEKKDVITVGKAVDLAIAHCQVMMEDYESSRFLPLLEEHLKLVLSVLSGQTKAMPIAELKVGVTTINAKMANDKEIVLWAEDNFIPFASFAHMLTNKSREKAWCTSNWILTGANLTPLKGSVGAALWLLDVEAGIPFTAQADGTFFSIQRTAAGDVAMM